jgi:quercetin dioxygenase-like cupin family protein
LYITALEEVKKIVPDMESAKGVYKQIPISKENGTPTFSFRVFTIEPEGHTPLHTHPFEHLNYVIKGRGVVVDENREYDVKKGDFVMFLPDEVHHYKNISTSVPLVIIYAVPKDYE